MIWTEEELCILREKYYNGGSDELCKLLGRSPAAIRSKACLLNLKRNSNYRDKNRFYKYKCNSSFFDIPNLLNCYWAGFIAADGNVGTHNNRITINLSRIDKQHIERFIYDTEFTGKSRDIISTQSIFNNQPQTYYQTSVAINNKKWKVALRDIFKIIPRKSLILEPPNLEDEMAYAFIIGYIDGDGTITVSKNRIKLSLLSTHSFTNWVMDKFDKLCVPVGSYHARPFRRKNANVWTYAITGYRALTILSYLDSFDVPKLTRKWNVFRNYKQDEEHIYDWWKNRFTLAV